MDQPRPTNKLVNILQNFADFAVRGKGIFFSKEQTVIYIHMLVCMLCTVLPQDDVRDVRAV